MEVSANSSRLVEADTASTSRVNSKTVDRARCIDVAMTVSGSEHNDCPFASTSLIGAAGYRIGHASGQGIVSGPPVPNCN